MNVTVKQRKTCRLCGGEDLELVFPLAPSPLADSYVEETQLDAPQPCYPLDLHLCHHCGMVQLLTVVQPEGIYRDYLYETSSSLGLVDHFAVYARSILERLSPRAGALVVDLGSNDGSLLRAFKRAGHRVLGVDPAVEIARRASHEGVPTVPEFFTPELASRLRAEEGPAAVITANNLVANVDDLVGLTDSIRHLLDEDGVFVMESFYLVDWMQNMVFDFTYHEHLSYFAVKPLAAFFRARGMELFDVQRVPTKGGSVRYFVQRAGGPRAVTSVVRELLALEERLAMDRAETFAAYGDRIQQLKAELHELLGTEGNVAGYGASATSTTLIYHHDLGDTLDFLVDENPAKVGLYSPGHHLPVFSPGALLERRPARVLLLAWRYAEPIVKKNREYLEQGGEFILPLPRVEVVR